MIKQFHKWALHVLSAYVSHANNKWCVKLTFYSICMYVSTETIVGSIDLFHLGPELVLFI